MTVPSKSSRACPSGKRIYGNERVATRAVNVARDRGELPPMKHYLCPYCGHYHLAKKAPGQGDRMRGLRFSERQMLQRASGLRTQEARDLITVLGRIRRMRLSGSESGIGHFFAGLAFGIALGAAFVVGYGPC